MCGKNDVKVCKMNTKTYFVIFSNDCSILELMFCNQKLTKLVYPTLLSSNFSAYTLELSEHLKKITKFSIQTGPLRTISRQL